MAHKTNSILVTGGSGMLGQALQKIMPDAAFISHQEFDLKNELFIDCMFRDYAPKVIIHTAAKVGGILDNMRNPEDYFYENVMMDTLLVRYARKYNVKQFIGILSTCAYPDVASKYPMTEERLHEGPPAPTNFAYGYAKRAMAVHIDATNQQYGTKYQYLIPCNLYSGNPVKDQAKAHFLDTFIEKVRSAIKKGSDSILLMGTGQAKRQYLHVDDLARIIKETVDRGITDSFNVCPDENLSIERITQIALRVVGYEREKYILWDRKCPDGQLNKQADNARFKALFPDFKFTSLEEGLGAAFQK